MHSAVVACTCALSLLAAPIFADSAPFVLLRGEVNQGLEGYPLVAGKTTLARAFIGPSGSEPLTIDDATLSIEGPVNSVIEATMPRHTFAGGPLDYSENANINFYIDGDRFPEPGPYLFVVLLFRDGKTLGELDLGVHEFHSTRDLGLLVLFGPDPYRDPDDLRKDPVVWPYISSALETLGSTFPLRDGVGLLPVRPPCNATGGLMYTVFPDLVTDSFNNEIQLDALRRFRRANLSGPLTCAFPDRVVSFGRANDNSGRDFINGVEGGDAHNGGGARVAVALDATGRRGKGGAGMTLGQEVAHTFGLVSEDAPNSDGGAHSKNFYIADFSAFNLRNRVSLAPRAITDPINPDDFICRHPYTPPPPGVRWSGPTSVMASENDQQCVLLETFDWRALLLQYGDAARTDERQTIGGPAFYLAGRFRNGTTLERLDSRVLPAPADPDPAAVESPYSLAFLGADSRELSSFAFRVHTKSTHTEANDDPHFNVVAPFPQATARVEVRLEGITIASMSRSTNAPQVTLTGPAGKTVSTISPLLPISWQASDPDGDSLTFTLWVSGDGGRTFLPIGVPFDDATRSYIWDTSFIAPTTAGVIRIEASDGFNVATATSPFSVATNVLDCNGNGINDATEPDIDGSGVPDACEQGRALRIVTGVAAGGTATATVTGWSAVCTETVITVAGQSPATVATALASALASSACLTSQGIVASANGSAVIVRGLQIDSGDLTLTFTDSGLQQTGPAVPTSTPLLLMVLATVLALVALRSLRS